MPKEDYKECQGQALRENAVPPPGSCAGLQAGD